MSFSRRAGAVLTAALVIVGGVAQPSWATGNSRPSTAATGWQYGQALVLKVSVVPGTVRDLDIRGINFRYVDRVTVAGRAATAVKRISATQVRATAPNDTNGRVGLVVETATLPSPTVALYGHAYLATPTISLVPDLTRSGGATTTLYGTNLAGVNRIYVGGVPAARIFPVYNTTELTVALPAHPPGRWHIRAANPYATSPATDSDKTYYTAPRTMSWEQHGRFDSTRGAMTDVSCPTDAFCAAVDRYHLYTSADGDHWTLAASAPGDAQLGDVACADATFCMVDVGGGYVRAFDGIEWSAATFLSDDGIFSLDCPSAHSCTALDGGGYAFRFDGRTWAPAGRATTSFYPESLTCPSATFCATVARSGFSVLSDGVWISEPVPDLVGPVSIDCPSRPFCVAVSQQGQVATRRNGTWSDPVDVFEHWDSQAVACRSAVSCVAVDNEGEASVWDGVTWSAPSDLAGVGDHGFRASCAPARCVVTDTLGRAYTHDDDGWSDPQQVVVAVGAVTDVSCAGPEFCMTVSTAGAVRLWDGAQWQEPVAVDVGDVATHGSEIDCVSSSFCVVTGARAHVAMWDGVSWSVPTALWPLIGDPHSPDSNYEHLVLHSLACVSESFCIVSGGDDRWATWDGRTWTTHDEGGPSGVTTCTSATYCRSGTQLWDGSSWSEDLAVPAVDELSCAPDGLCIGAAQTGPALLLSDGWHVQTLPIGTRYDCLSQQWCLAIEHGITGAAPRTWNGTYWSDGGNVPVGGAHISCWEPDHCVLAEGAVAYVGSPYRPDR